MSYTNRASGVGVIAAELLKWLPCDSMLSVLSAKGQEPGWCERQLCAGRPETPVIRDFLGRYKPDALVYIETPFDGPAVIETCRAAGVTTAGIVMHESYRRGPVNPDVYLCPVRVAWDKVADPFKVYWPLPFDAAPFPYKHRRKAKRFLHVMGYGLNYNRRQTREVVDGFLAADVPGATLTVHCQQDWRDQYGEVHDPRVEYRLTTFTDPAEVYTGFDVLLQPDSYAGYGRPLLEAQACGLPVVTTDAPPFNEFVRDPLLLVPVARVSKLDPPSQSQTGINTRRYLVSVDGVADAVRRVAGADIGALSKAARAAAQSHAWTKTRAAEFRAILARVKKETTL